MPDSVPSPLPSSGSIPRTKTLKVLFVDDQEILLKAVERVVKRQTKNWQVQLAVSGNEAIEHLKGGHFDVVVTDMRMPGMDGVELLEHVKEHYPNIIRIILSGYSKNERTITAVRVAHQYFIKPFSTHELIEALELTHSLYKRIRNPGLQGIIASIDRLPTPKRVYYEIQEAIQNPHTTVEQIAAIISKDTGITGKLLQVVNSAFFGQSRRIECIENAVTVLGVEAIRSLVLIAGIASDHKEMLNGIISINLYSQHCFEVGTLAKNIAHKLHKSQKDQNTLFTIGLLHDVGKLVILKKYAETYTENGWREDPFTTKVHITQIEKLADDHSGIGAALVALWGLPARIVNTIAYYEHPESVEIEDHQYTLILHLADGISNYLHSKNPLPLFQTTGYLNTDLIQKSLTHDQLDDVLQIVGDLKPHKVSIA